MTLGSRRTAFGRFLPPSLLAAGLVLAGCATTSSGARVEAPYLHPVLAQPDRPLAGLSSFGARASKTSVKPPAARPRTTTPKPAPRRPTEAVPPPALPDMAGDVDRRRAEMVRSAERLIGIRRSFDERSFLGHILRVNDLLPAGNRPESVSALEFERLALSKGRAVDIRSALPGDIVLFRCGEGCGPAGRDGVAAGVVLRTYEERVEFVSYVESVVRACHSGVSRKRLPSRHVPEVVGVISIAPSVTKRASAEVPPR